MDLRLALEIIMGIYFILCVWYHFWRVRELKREIDRRDAMIKLYKKYSTKTISELQLIEYMDVASKQPQTHLKITDLKAAEKSDE